MWKLIVSEVSIQMCPDEAESLGRRSKNGEISMSPKKVDAILNYVRPTTQKSLRRFLGLVEWHAPFIPNLATAAAPLHDLTGSDPWRWSRTHDLAFERVKHLINKDVKLASIESDTLAPQGTSPVHRSKPPSPDEKVENEAEGNYLFVSTDASIVGTSGVLAVGKNWWSARPVGYCSRKHDTARSRWGAYKQELVGLVNAAEVWKDVLLNQHVVFVTDNDAVSKLGSQNEREEWQAKVAVKLSILDHEVQWIEGQYNVAADALSRQYEDGDPKEREVMRVFNLLDEEDPDGKTREFRPMDRPQRARRAPAFHNNYVATPRRKQRPADAIFAEREARYEEDLPDLLDGETRLPAIAHVDNPSITGVRLNTSPQPGEGAEQRSWTHLTHPQLPLVVTYRERLVSLVRPPMFALNKGRRPRTRSARSCKESSRSRSRLTRLSRRNGAVIARGGRRTSTERRAKLRKRSRCAQRWLGSKLRTSWTKNGGPASSPLLRRRKVVTPPSGRSCPTLKPTLSTS